MKTIKFDLSCFRVEFQEYIFKKLDCSDYFDFINKFENNFSLNLLNINDQNNIIIEDNTNTCTFNNLTSVTVDDSSLLNTLNEKNTLEDNLETNIERIVARIDSDSSEEEDDDKSDMQFSHYFENDQIYVIPSKKFVSKKLGKIMKKNNGYWVKQKNIWLFPMSSKHYVENILNSQNSSNLIKNVNQEKDKVVIYPKQDHPKYGSSCIYDKAGNLGIWDNSIKGWVFQKKN